MGKGRNAICAHCGETFWQTHHLQKYCSDECYDAVAKKRQQESYQRKREERIAQAKEYYRRTRQVKDKGHAICLYCGEEFEPRNIDHKFCSEECSVAYRKGKYTVAKYTESICLNCGEKFINATGNQKYCCVECRDEKIAERETVRKLKTKAENKRYEAEYMMNEAKKLLEEATEIEQEAQKIEDKSEKLKAVSEEHKKRQMQKVVDTKKKLSLPKRKCAYCGKSFTPTGANQKYCTPHCYAEKQRNKSEADEYKHYIGGYAQIICGESQLPFLYRIANVYESNTYSDLPDKPPLTHKDKCVVIDILPCMGEKKDRSTVALHSCDEIRPIKKKAV